MEGNLSNTAEIAEASSTLSLSLSLDVFCLFGSILVTPELSQGLDSCHCFLLYPILLAAFNQSFHDFFGSLTNKIKSPGNQEQQRNLVVGR